MDPADERFEVRCFSCPERGQCDRCGGDGAVEVTGSEVVTVRCGRCEGDGGWYDDTPSGELWTTCGDCDGDGELTGPAEDVCTVRPAREGFWL